MLTLLTASLWLGADTAVPSELFSPAWLIAAAGSVLAAIGAGRYFVPKFTYDRETKRADRYEEEIARLNRVTSELMVPALEHSTAALREAADKVAVLQAENVRLKRRA